MAAAAILRRCRASGTIRRVDDEPLIYREEITAALLALHDVNENVAHLVDIFGEDVDGEAPEDDA